MYIQPARGKNKGVEASDTHRQKEALSREIVIQESDLGKMQQEKTRLETEFRRLKKEMERTEMIMKNTRERLEKTDEEIRQTGDFLKGLKKKLNML